MDELLLYSACGIPTAMSGSRVAPFGFKSSYTDSTGLIYLINRYYDPTTGQFVSVDPMVISTGQAYSYAGGNPVNVTDPLGLKGGPGAAEEFLCGGRSNQSACDSAFVKNYEAQLKASESNSSFLVFVGVVLGVAAAATGVGAVIELGTAVAAGTLISSEGVGLAISSTAFGLGASALDGRTCINSDFHNASACAGASFGAAGSLGGLATLGLPEVAAQIVGIWALGTGAFATGIDIMNALGAEGSTPCTKP
jgi:RHS repeat-associated protein